MSSSKEDAGLFLEFREVFLDAEFAFFSFFAGFSSSSSADFVF